MKRNRSRPESVLVALGAAILACSGCAAGLIGVSFVGLIGGGGGGGRAHATVHGSVEIVNAMAGTDGCARWQTSSGCSGVVCNLQPGEPLTVTCSDPILVQWRDDWTVSSTAWSAPVLQASGAILVEPVTSYSVPPEFGPVLTDPGYTAHVLRLDSGSLPPTVIELEITFDRGAHLHDCVKGVRVTTASSPSGLRYLVPADAAGLDLSALTAPDPHVFCIDALAVERTRWQRVKALFR